MVLDAYHVLNPGQVWKLVNSLESAAWTWERHDLAEKGRKGEEYELHLLCKNVDSK